MFAIVKDGAIQQVAPSVQRLFSYTVPEGAGFNSMVEFMVSKNVVEVVNAERKNEEYYFVTPGDLTLVGGVATQQYINTAKRLVDEDAKDSGGNQIYVQEWDADANDGAGDMVDTSEKQINYGLKTSKTAQVKQIANSSLARTDWVVIRKAERDVDIPSATATYRAAVITECARLEAAIAGAADVDALAVVMGVQNWPKES